MLVINLNEWMDRVESGRRKSYPVEDVSSRTSLTPDEAVAIMLGYMDGPFVARSFNENPSDEELEFLRGVEFDVNDWLTGRRDSLETEYLTAKEENLSEVSTNERREALEQGEYELLEATRRLGEIEKELENGETSVLKIDRQLSNDNSQYITLESLDDWAKKKSYGNRIFSLSGVRDRTPIIPAQDKVIFKALESLGYDPMSLPQSRNGFSGVRSKVKQVVARLSCFRSPSAFKHAWQRRIDANKTAGKESPPIT